MISYSTTRHIFESSWLGFHVDFLFGKKRAQLDRNGMETWPRISPRFHARTCRDLSGMVAHSKSVLLSRVIGVMLRAGLVRVFIWSAAECTRVRGQKDFRKHFFHVYEFGGLTAFPICRRESRAGGSGQGFRRKLRLAKNAPLRERNMRDRQRWVERRKLDPLLANGSANRWMPANLYPDLFCLMGIFEHDCSSFHILLAHAGR